jgi:hypothetical protein
VALLTKRFKTLGRTVFVEADAVTKITSSRFFQTVYQCDADLSRHALASALSAGAGI